MTRLFAVGCFAIFSSISYADQGGLISSAGGSLASISIANQPGILAITPPSLTFTSTDGSRLINATFAASNAVESCSGGGKGGHITCFYTFTGSFSGTLTVNGSAQAINGTTTQYYGTAGNILSGITGYNSAYTPFYYTDNGGRILRSDDLSGTNTIAYGSGQFYGTSGIAVDSLGRIYVTDTYNDRIARIDDMNGTNFTSFGTYGSGAGQFDLPQAISVDPTGHIWVLDGGNGRLIRMDDMNGANWTVVGAGGSGVGQYGAIAGAPAFDSLGRIYIADSSNRWIVRFDDLKFTNWTVLSQSQPVGPYIYQFGQIYGVAVDPAGKIYVASDTNIIRVDDMTGANWSSIGIGTFPPKTVSVDSSGMVLLGNGYEAQAVDSQAAVLTSTIDGVIIVNGVYAWVYGAVPVPLPSSRPSAIRFTPNTLTFSQNVGAASAPQTVIISNFGGSPLTGLTVSAAGGFAQTDDCPSTLQAGASCTVSVTFTPSASGTVTGTLNISDESGNAGTAQTVVLNGTGTTPAATFTPTSLSFSFTVIGATSAARTITLRSTGTGPLKVSTIVASAPFSKTDNCTAAPIASGSSCSISVTFSPTTAGSATGSVTITDNAGKQIAALSGSGVAPVTFSPSSLSFGNLAVGSTGAARSVTVTNRMSTALSFSSIVASGPFAIASNTCGAGIAASGSCSVGVAFTPTGLGAATGTLTFTDSAVTSPQMVTLSGTGAAPVTLSTSSLSFGTTAVGSTSSPKSVTLTNNQSGLLTLSGIVTSGPFGISSNTCGTSVAAGATCTVGVTFTPTASGAATGALTFTDSAGNSPQTVTLGGAGSSSSSPVTLSATSLNLGTVAVGSTSAAVTVTLTNRQSTALSSLSVGISGPFAIANNSCGTSVATGANCAVQVTFTPTATGAASGTLTFTDNASNSPQKVSLSGSGSAAITLSATTLNFGVVALGSSSASQSVTVTNTTGGAVGVTSIGATGDYKTTTTCGSSIAGGGNCSVSVTFTPSAAGTRIGSLTVTLSTGAQTVSLTGIGSSSSATGVLSFSPSAVTFNNGYTIGDNPSQTVTVTNISSSSAAIAGIGLSGDPSITQRNTCTASLGAGASCTITVTFKPVAYGTFTSTLRVTEGNGAVDTVSVTGVSTVDN
ncbi:MAG TPA: choice-of-anchor D domain-containing protein [Bryobacteraceae bacterium]